MSSVNLNDLLLGEGEFLNLQDSLRRALHQSLTQNKEQEILIKELKKEIKSLKEDFSKRTIYDHDLESKIKTIMMNEMNKATSDYYFNINSTSSPTKRKSSLLFPSSFINDIEKLKVKLSKLTSEVEKKPSLEYFNSVLATKLNKIEQKELVDNVYKSFERASLQKYEQLSYDLMKLKETVDFYIDDRNSSVSPSHYPSPPTSRYNNDEDKFDEDYEEIDRRKSTKSKRKISKQSENSTFTQNLDRILSNPIEKLTTNSPIDINDPFIRKSELLTLLKTKVNEEDLIKKLGKKVDLEKFHEVINIHNNMIKNHEAYITRDSLSPFNNNKKDFVSTVSSMQFPTSSSLNSSFINNKKKTNQSNFTEGDDFSNNIYEYFKEGKIDTLAQTITDQMKIFHSDLLNLKNNYNYIKDKLKEAADASKVEVLAAVTEEQRLRIDGILQGSIRIFPLYKELKLIRDDIEKVEEKTRGENGENLLNFSLRVNKNLRELYEMETKNSQSLITIQNDYEKNLHNLTKLDTTMYTIREKINNYDNIFSYLSFNETNFKSLKELGIKIKDMENYMTSSLKKLEEYIKENFNMNDNTSKDMNQKFTEELRKLNHFKDFLNEKLNKIEENMIEKFNSYDSNLKISGKKNDLLDEKIKQLKELFLSNSSSISNKSLANSSTSSSSTSSTSSSTSSTNTQSVPISSHSPTISTNLSMQDDSKQNLVSSVSPSKKSHYPQVTTASNSIESIQSDKSKQQLPQAFHSVPSMLFDQSSESKQTIEEKKITSKNNQPVYYPPPNRPLDSPSSSLKVNNNIDPMIQQFYQRHPEYSSGVNQFPPPSSPSIPAPSFNYRSQINVPIIDYESGLSSIYSSLNDVKVPILTSLVPNQNFTTESNINTYSSTHQFMSLSDVDKRLEQLEKEKNSLRNILLSKI